MRQVRPDQADHCPAGDFTEQVLTTLLTEQGVCCGLAGPKELLVLHLAVEFAEDSMVRPREVRDSDEVAVRVPYVELQLGFGKVLVPEQVATAAFADRLSALAHQPDCH